jgi:hypothetical protein
MPLTKGKRTADVSISDDGGVRLQHSHARLSCEPQFVVVLQEFHVVERRQKLHGKVFTRFYSRLGPMLAGLWQVVWQVVNPGSDLGPITSE